MALFKQTQRHNPTPLKIPNPSESTSVSLTFPSLSAASSPDTCTLRGSDSDIADSWDRTSPSRAHGWDYRTLSGGLHFLSLTAGPAVPVVSAARLPWGSAAAAPVSRADTMPLCLPEELSVFPLADRKQSEMHESSPCASFIKPAGLVDFTCLRKAN